MLIRYSSSLTLGACITAGLLLLMQGLIATDRAPALAEQALPLPPFVRVARPAPEIETIDRPDLPEVAPAPEPPVVGPSPVGPPVVIGGTPQPPEQPGAMGPGWLGPTDGALLLIVAVAPTYPPAAEARNIEGYVVVEYTVTRTGSVRDVRVIESTDRVFERSAVAAAYKFKYRPQIVDREPVEVPGVRQRMRFVLDRGR